MRPYLPAFMLSVALGPFVLTGCDGLIAKLKGGDADAGSDAAPTVATAVDAAAPVATVAPPLTDAAAPPLPTGTLTAPRPVTVLDAGGKPADAGTVVKADGGPAPAPTPTLTIPTNLFDGGFKFDAGGLRWPPG